MNGKEDKFTKMVLNTINHYGIDAKHAKFRKEIEVRTILCMNLHATVPDYNKRYGVQNSIRGYGLD